jgi:hypothetical protein
MGKAGWSGWLWLLVVVWGSSALAARAQPETAGDGVGYAPPPFGGLPVPFHGELTKPPCPADEAARPHLKARHGVEFLGLFWLKDGGADRFVCLYAEDSNNDPRNPNDPSVGLPGPTPNKFALLAIYRDDAGKWRQSRLYSASCADCRKAWQVGLEGAIVKLKRWAKRPSFKRIRFAKGKLVIEDTNYKHWQAPPPVWDVMQYRPQVVRLDRCELMPQVAQPALVPGRFLPVSPGLRND